MLGASLIAAAAVVPLPLGEAGRGKELFRIHKCVACHGVNGEGGRVAPDLGTTVGRGYSPSEMAARMWNHAPKMWAALEKRGLARPALSAQDAADLFVYLYAARYFDAAGDAGRGRRLFRSKRCAECHGITSAIPGGGKPINQWDGLHDPVVLVERMWNHSSQILAALARKGIPYPRLTPQELSDILVYLRGLPEVRARAAAFAPGSPESGQAVFGAKGCAGCHQGALSLERRSARYGLSEFTAAMWNHGPTLAARAPRLTRGETSGLVGYLVSLQFLEERGSAERGRQVFMAKRCAACHNDPASGAPNLSVLRGEFSAPAMVRALWEHGPEMYGRMRRKGISWPRFSGAEMADLTAYLRGPEFKRRAMRR